MGSVIRSYTDLEDFCNGVLKLRDQYRKLNRDKCFKGKFSQMPVLFKVDDGPLAPVGIVLQETVSDGVEAIVLSGSSKCMENVTKKSRKEQLKEISKNK